MSDPAINTEHLEVLETVHSLVREAVALEKLVAGKLSGRPHTAGEDIADFGSSASFRDEILSVILRRRLLAQDLRLEEATNIIRTACIGFDRFRYVVENLLGSLAKQQQLKPTRDRLDMKSVIHSVVELLESSAEEKRIQISFGQDEDGIVFGDRNLLIRACFNILDNAIKYSYPLTGQAEKRFISIDSRHHNTRGDWSIAVKSYGVGIDEDEIQSGAIFRYGIRGRRADERGRTGTGVGLAEARRIVLAHGGDIKIESKVLEAAFVTVVRIVIPR